MPVNRAQERLFAASLAPYPAAPMPLDYNCFVNALSQHLNELAKSGKMLSSQLVEAQIRESVPTLSLLPLHQRPISIV